MPNSKFLIRNRKWPGALKQTCDVYECGPANELIGIFKAGFKFMWKFCNEDISLWHSAHWDASLYIFSWQAQQEMQK